MTDRSALATPFAITDQLRLRNRFVATAHGRAGVYDGVPSQVDADYWARVAAGGVGMCIAGGTVIGPTSTYRTRMLTEAWRPEIVPGLKLRADAMHDGGAAAVLQILHLGRETLGAEIYYAPVAPSAVRSPREPARPRPLTESELDDVVEGFRLSALHAAEAGFDGIELHAAHGYLLGQLLSPVANRRPGAETVQGRVAPILRIVRAVRQAAPGRAVGLRLSVGDPEDSGLSLEMVAETLPAFEDDIDYVNLTAGMRSDYVRDMGTPRPSLIEDVARLRSMTTRPLLVSHGFRDPAAMEEALEAGADLVGMARALIADPDLPTKALDGRRAEIRPCVACNEDCRSFDPALLCTVNPDLAAPGDVRRRAAPLIRRPLRPAPDRVAVVGAGPAGLESALALQRAGIAEVVVFDEAEAIGGTLRTVATAPNRGGWARILDYYAKNLDPSRVQFRLGTHAEPADVADFDALVLAVGAPETPAESRAEALTVTAALAAGAGALTGASHLVVVDDGFSWWPHVNAIELGVAAGVEEITLVTPGTSFAMGIPAEARTSLLKRLRGSVRFTMMPLTAVLAADADGVDLQSATSGERSRLGADAVIAVGERCVRDWSSFEGGTGPGVVVIGDAVTPRRVAHAIAEGRAAAETVRAGAPVEPGSLAAVHA